MNTQDDIHAIIHVKEHGHTVAYMVASTTPEWSLGYTIHRYVKNGTQRIVETYIPAVDDYGVLTEYDSEDGVIKTINNDVRFNAYDTLYYYQVDKIDSIPDTGKRATVEQENSLIFHVPINLLFAAVCCESPDNSFYDKQGRLIMNVVRYNDMITCYPTDTVYGAHSIPLNHDDRTMIQYCPRSLEHRLFLRLIECEAFVSRVNNGNLFLAFMDIYYDNNDDGTLDLKEPGPGVTNLMYNHYLPPGIGNPLTAMTKVELNDGNKFFSFESHEFDAVLVELIQDAIKRRVEMFIKRERDQEKS